MCRQIPALLLKAVLVTHTKLVGPGQAMRRKVRRLHHGLLLTRQLGPRWVAFRMSYAIRLRSGSLERQLPVRDWSDVFLAELLNDAALSDAKTYLQYRRDCAPQFLFASDDREAFSEHFCAWDAGSVGPQFEANDTLGNSLRYFTHQLVEFGSTIDWHRNPFSNLLHDRWLHWTRINEFSQGDIKVIWEPSRFSFVYSLVRAYWRTGNPAYAECFWQLVEQWHEYNPPQQGANWRCGQEASLRIMAWCFGLYGFLDAPATTPDRIAQLGIMIGMLGQRIEANIGYALSQRNNHGVSEAAGLWTIGVLFPEFVSAERWRERGRRELESQVLDQIYDDGGYAMHSVNYHRFVIHTLLWAIQIGDRNGYVLSRALRERVQRSAEFFYQIQDADTGQVPYFGQNDGSVVLPLSNCAYRDFRPVVQSASYAVSGVRRYESGPWDEDILWLYGVEALSAPVAARERSDLDADVAGCYTQRASNGFALLRAPSFRHRPGHADLLHLDIWWQGQNVALDAGTYSYNVPGVWDNALVHTRYHNTVSIDGLSQMELGSRFLFLPWASSRLHSRRSSEQRAISYIEASHDGYRRLKDPVDHRRGVLRLGEHTWLVLDALKAQTEHDYFLHWLLPDWPYDQFHSDDFADPQRHPGYHLQSTTPSGSYHYQMGCLGSDGQLSVVRADGATPRGWLAPSYFQRQPAVSLGLESRASRVMFWSLLGPHEASVNVSSGKIIINFGQTWLDVSLHTSQRESIVQDATFRTKRGDLIDAL